MARTVSTAQQDVLNSTKYEVHLRVEIENSTGGMVNLSGLSSFCWPESAAWSWTLDQPVPSLTVKLARDRGRSSGESLAPLDEGSTFNYNSTNGFASLVYPGRAINVYTAVSTPGGPALSSSQMDFVFQGELDEVNWEQSPMQLRGRSRNMARLADRWIESSSYVYGSATGDPIETVISNILSDWTDLSTSILQTSSSPGFAISPAYTPEKQPVLDAVTTLAQLVGWNLQEVWSSSAAEWKIKFSRPNRTASSSQASWTFGPQHYYDVRRMSVSRYDVRNRIPVIFGLSSARQKIILESTDSQDKYGIQFMEFEEAPNSAIGTSSEAFDLGNGALQDLKEPPAEHEIEVPYWFIGELGDFIEFEPNGVHYSEYQYFGMYSISHEVATNRHRSAVQVRGAPAAYSRTWLTFPGFGTILFNENTVDHTDRVSSSTSRVFVGDPVRIPANSLEKIRGTWSVNATFPAPTSTAFRSLNFVNYIGTSSGALPSGIQAIVLSGYSASASTQQISGSGVYVISAIPGTTTMEFVATVTYDPPFRDALGNLVPFTRSSGTLVEATSNENFIFFEIFANSTNGGTGTIDWTSVEPKITQLAVP